MCGLAGLIGTGINKVHREAYKELLYVSALRGREGTGVAVIDTLSEGRQVKTIKTVGDSNELLSRHGQKGGVLSSEYADIFLGHCRWPTSGRVNAANVHPFDTGSLVGAHNGTLESVKFRHKHKTDSEVMFSAMEREGILPVLGGLRSWDAYAISIYSKKSRSVFLAHNRSRPLAVAICKHSDVMFWASEFLMLYLVCGRNGISVDVFTLSENRLYEISPDMVKKGNETPWTVEDIPLPPRTEDDVRYEAWLKGSIKSDLDDKIPF